MSDIRRSPSELLMAACGVIRDEYMSTGIHDEGEWIYVESVAGNGQLSSMSRHRKIIARGYQF